MYREREKDFLWAASTCINMNASARHWMHRGLIS